MRGRLARRDTFSAPLGVRRGWPLSAVSIRDTLAGRCILICKHIGLSRLSAPGFPRRRALIPHLKAASEPLWCAALMPPRIAMAALPPPCLALKDAISGMVLEVCLAGLRGYKDALGDVLIPSGIAGVAYSRRHRGCAGGGL